MKDNQGRVWITFVSGNKYTFIHNERDMVNLENPVMIFRVDTVTRVSLYLTLISSVTSPGLRRQHHA